MNDKKELLHYGIKRRSGRYPWGSGERSYQSTKLVLRTALKRGGTVQNISAKDRKLDKSSFYVSYLPKDKEYYRTVLGNQYLEGFMDDKAHKKVYVNKFKAKEDIKVPLGSDIPRIYNNAYNRDKENFHKILKETDPELYKNFKRALDNTKKYSDQQKWEWYLEATSKMMYWDTNYRDKVFKQLEIIGANAIKITKIITERIL